MTLSLTTKCYLRNKRTIKSRSICNKGYGIDILADMYKTLLNIAIQ